MSLRGSWLVAVIVAACVGIACANTPSAQTGTGGPALDSATVRHQVDAAMQRFNRFMRAGPPDSVAAMFTPNGELYESREGVHQGREAIRDFFAPLTVDVRIESAVTTTQAIEIFGKSVFQWGEYVENGGAVSQPTRSFRGRFVAEWLSQGNGRWLLRRMMLQSLTNR